MLIRLGTLLAQVDGASGVYPVDDPRLLTFLSGAERSAVCDVRVEVEVCRDGTREFASGILETWRASTQPGCFEVTNSDWTATFDTPRRQVKASLHGPWRGALDSLLKTVVQVYALVCGKGLVLHASSVERGQMGYVFVGASGAGKSTVAVLSRSAGMGELLSEEMTFLGLGAKGERPCVATLPFPQKNLVRVESRRCPIAGVYALEQSHEVSVVQMSRADQVASVAKATSIGIREASLMDLALDAAGRLVDEIHVDRLRFRRSPEFWQAIAGDATHVGQAACASSGGARSGGPAASLREEENCS